MRGLAIVVAEFFATDAQVVVDLKTHEDFEAVQNVGELIFARFGIPAPDFAGDSAVDNSGRGVAIAGFPFRNAGGKNCAIERVNRLGDGERFFVDEKFDGRNDVAETFVVKQFGEIDGVVLSDPVFYVGGGQIKELLGDSVVGNDESSCRRNLDVGFCCVPL